MSVTTISIFNGTTTPNSENNSANFTAGIGFYLIAPTSTDEIEIDIYLQVELTVNVTRMVRLEPLNISNTERLTVIPPQLRDLGLPMYLAIFPSEAINLEILLLQPVCTEAIICNQLTQINQKVDALTTAIQEINTDNNSQNIMLDLILSALNILAPVSPIALNSTSTNQLFATGFF